MDPHQWCSSDCTVPFREHVDLVCDVAFHCEVQGLDQLSGPQLQYEVGLEIQERCETQGLQGPSGLGALQRPIAPFVAMPFVTSSFLLLVVMPGAPSSVLAPSRNAFVPRKEIEPLKGLGPL